MAVAYDTSNKFFVNVTTSGSAALTIASGAALFVFVRDQSTFDGNLLTFTWNTVESFVKSAISDTSFEGVQFWYLLTPTSGAHNVDVTWSGSHACSFNIISLTGTATSPIGASGSSGLVSTAAPTNSITTTNTDSMVIDGLVVGANKTVVATGSGQTLRQNTLDTNENSRFVTSTVPAATIASWTTSYSWTGATNTSLLQVEIKAPGSAGGTSRKLGLLGVGN